MTRGTRADVLLTRGDLRWTKMEEALGVRIPENVTGVTISRVQTPPPTQVGPVHEEYLVRTTYGYGPAWSQTTRLYVGDMVDRYGVLEMVTRRGIWGGVLGLR